MQRPWLEKLKLVELHRIAALIGSPSSGSKSTRTANIQHTLRQTSTRIQNGQTTDFSVVSIDMGIRNLAFCHLKSASPVNPKLGRTHPVELEAWQRVSFGSGSPTKTRKASSLAEAEASVQKESFEPTDYARYAYQFVKRVIDECQPTHVLIERQRFRSGGQAAVQEWSIRVGVFEGILYAIFRALIEQEYCRCEVLPMLPVQVNQYWTMQNPEVSDTKIESKMVAKAMKKYKIDLVGKMLESAAAGDAQLTFSTQASENKTAFLARLRKNCARGSDPALRKLDDLSDSLLQGLAWLSWQRNGFLMNKLGEEGLNFLLGASEKSGK